MQALRSASLREVGQWVSRARSTYFTRPSCVADDELREEEQSTRTSAKAKWRSPQDEAVSNNQKTNRKTGQVPQSNSFEPAVRSVTGAFAATVETLRAACARWVRGHAKAVKRLEKSNAWRNGLSECEREHMIKTWNSLRLPGREKHNRRLVLRFQDSLNEFAWWSLRSGFSLSSEIELINPRVVEHVVFQRRSDLDWSKSGLPQWVFRSPWRYDPDSSEKDWITDYDVVWTPHHRLRARSNAKLTKYGQDRLKATKRGAIRGRKSKIKHKGRWHTLAELARLPEAVVSDKAIAKRLAEGWGVTEAITTPAQVGGRPRKSRAEIDKP